ncbi:hypothetical protein LCGC14_0399180 [marine sediment metagenome]|uniref:Uncharacterized protein n=1 Tax=marine sediment metagenome TaxID=412755 RepID=A0A0F9TFI2_9ZZZZ|nr:hypothetical protein [Candidatus Aminicenantes bacterium]
MIYISGVLLTGGLFVLIVVQGLQSFFERRKFLTLIDRLTDKVMSRDYRDYVWGQDMKKGVPPPTFRDRSDEAEARIEEENKRATELVKKAGGLSKQLEVK